MIVLTDIPAWVAPLTQRLDGLSLYDLTINGWPKDLAQWDLVFNRLSASQNHPLGTSLLLAAELRGIDCINGSRCHQIGLNKLLQACLFEGLGLKTPWTGTNPSRAPAGELLVKPLAGGYGKGIRPFDGRLQPGELLQQRLRPADQRVHRVEVLGGEVLYQASLPVGEGFNYCLGAWRQAEVAVVVPPQVAEAVTQIARAAGMEVGSLEYLLDGSDQPWFIDLNPVSTYACEEQLGFDPLDRQKEWLEKRWRKRFTRN